MSTKKKTDLPPVLPVVDPKELTPADPFYSDALKSLAIFHEEMMPNPVPICVSCPASNWYVMEDTLNCWCKELRRYPWTPGRSLPLCDSRGPARDAMLARKRQ